MLPWKLGNRQFLPVDQNLFSLANFQLVSSNLSLAMIWQMTYNHKLPKLCLATLTARSLEAGQLEITTFPRGSSKKVPFACRLRKCQKVKGSTQGDQNHNSLLEAKL